MIRLLICPGCCMPHISPSHLAKVLIGVCKP